MHENQLKGPMENPVETTKDKETLVEESKHEKGKRLFHIVVVSF